MKGSYEQFFAKAKAAKQDPEMPRPAPRAPQDQARFKTKPAGEAQLRKAMKMKKTRAPFPMRAVIGMAVALFAAGFYLACPDQVESLLSRIEVRAMGQAQAENAPAAPAEKSTGAASKTENTAAANPDAGPAKGPEAQSAVGEDLSHFEKLKQRKEELDQREKELSQLEEELQRQKVELDKRIAHLEDIRNQIAQTLKDRVQVDEEKVGKLVDLYSNMKPKQAADVITSINEELAVEVLAKMKKKNAAEIMNLMPPEKARVLSEKYTGYRRVSSVSP